MQTQMDYAVAYNEFLINEAYNQTIMADCIRKSIALAEGAEVLHEGFTDKIKEVWNTFVTFINKIWCKFKETFDKILYTDRGYLKQYHAIITQRKLKITELSMPEYKATIIAKTHAEHLDPNKLDDMNNGMNAYLNSINLPAEVKNYKGEETSQGLKAHLEAVFCGGSVEDKDYNIATINMTDIYDFCYDYKEKTLPDINKDFDAITKSAQTFKRLCDELEAANKNEQNKTGSEQINKQPSDQEKMQYKNYTDTIKQNNSEAQVKEYTAKLNALKAKYPNATWESVLGAFNVKFHHLNEINIGGNSNPGTDSAENKAGAAGGRTVDADAKFSKNASGLQGNEINNDTKAAAQQATTQSGFTVQQIDNAIKVYQNVNSAIISAKQHICEKMYKDYMAIIRWHVKSYVGEKGGKVAGDSGTDYSNSKGQPQQGETPGQVK